MKPCGQCKFFRHSNDWCAKLKVHTEVDSIVTGGCFAAPPIPKPPTTTLFDSSTEKLKVLQRVLLRMRAGGQGGFQSYKGDGQWTFLSTALPQTTPDELNALLELAGIVPDRIEPVGSCKDCRHSDNERSQGYKTPCVFCKTPFHDLWERAE